MIFVSPLPPRPLQLPFNCVGCGDKFTRKKLLTDHFSSCQAHLLNLLQQSEKQQLPLKAYSNEQSLVLPQQQTQPQVPVQQQKATAALLLQHSNIIHPTQLQQPVSHIQHQHQLDGALQLQSIPLLHQHVQRQSDEAFQTSGNEQEQLILLQNAVEEGSATEFGSSNIPRTEFKVQVFNIL